MRRILFLYFVARSQVHFRNPRGYPSGLDCRFGVPSLLGPLLVTRNTTLGGEYECIQDCLYELSCKGIEIDRNISRCKLYGSPSNCDWGTNCAGLPPPNHISQQNALSAIWGHSGPLVQAIWADYMAYNAHSSPTLSCFPFSLLILV